MPAEPRWIIVSNRLPYQYDQTTQSLNLSSGGLVTAITGIHSPIEKIWIGAVLDIEQAEWASAKPPAAAQLSFDQVVVHQEDYDRYYNGFSNDVLWPSFHYQSERVQFRHDDWAAYETVNQQFAEAIAAIATPGDLIWIHDFHLMLVPAYLKKINPDLTIGWFLHIPFPSSELFLELPVRRELLQGVLASDLIGFQDYGYVRHFSSAVKRVLGIETNLFEIAYRNHRTALGVFPVSIDYQRFSQSAQSSSVATLARRYQQTEFVFLGVDRLDYTKGVELKLESFRQLLQQNPDLQGRISLVQVAIPTRQEVEAYVTLRTVVERLVSEINGQFSTPDWTPIHYLYHAVDFEELLALYRAASCLVVSSKRDGMNLVALEYVAAQDDANPGVVLLSEFTGAKSLLSRAVTMNPRDIEGTANSMRQAIEQSLDERQAANMTMKLYLRHYTATDWGVSFMKKMTQVDIDESLQQVTLIQDPRAFIMHTIKSICAQPGVLMLDYDGTLAPICSRPEDARLSASMRQVLLHLAAQDHIDVVVVSGRDQTFLSDACGGLGVNLAAEHGAVYYDGVQWQSRIQSQQQDWYHYVLEIMRHYAKQVPDSFLEQKEYGVSWHYRNSPQAFAQYQALKLSDELQQGLLGTAARIIDGKKVIEVSAMEANKGSFARWFLAQRPEAQWGLAIGDDRTDEDMFHVLNDTCMTTIKVGFGPTQAQYRLAEEMQVELVLQSIVELNRG